MSEINELLVEISSESPAGIDCRHKEEYILLDDEIKKLTSIHDRNSVKYEKIERLSRDILKDISKDINVACYFSFSLLNKNKINDIIDSINFLSSFLNKYWGIAFPNLTRKKARVSIINWWIDKLSRIDFNKVEMDKQSKDILFRSFDDFNKLFKDILSEDIYFNVEELKVKINLNNKDFGLENSIIKEEKIEETDLIEDDKENNSIIDSILADYLPLPEQERELENFDTKTDYKKENIIFNDADLNHLDKEKLSTKYIETLANMNKILEKLFDKGSITSDFFIINRLYTWYEIDTLPVNENGKTLLKKPEEHHIEYIDKLYKDRNWLELLNESEKLFKEHIYWFDLHYFIYEALHNLNLYSEKSSIKFCIDNFVKKLKGVENLFFSDGKMPFANEKTKIWIKGSTKKSKQTKLLDDNEVLHFNWLFNQLEKTSKAMDINI